MWRDGGWGCDDAVFTVLSGGREFEEGDDAKGGGGGCGEEDGEEVSGCGEWGGGDGYQGESCRGRVGVDVYVLDQGRGYGRLRGVYNPSFEGRGGRGAWGGCLAGMAAGVVK